MARLIGGAGDRGIGDQLDHGAFELAHVRLGFRRDVIADVLGEIDAFHLGFLVENGHLGLEIGRLNIDHQAPFETGAQPLDQTGRAFGRGVA